MSEQLFEVTSLYTNTGIESFATDRLLRLTTLSRKPAHVLINLWRSSYQVVYWRLVDSFPYHCPNAVINRWWADTC